MNLATLIDRAQELAGRKDTSWDVRTRRWLNEAQSQWATELPWPQLKKLEDFTFNSTEASGRVMVFPQRVHKVLRIGDETNKRRLIPASHPDLEFPSSHFQNTSGVALNWREIGAGAVTEQPTSATTLDFQTITSDVFSGYIAGLAQDTTASGTPNELYFNEEEVSISSSDVTTTAGLYVRIDTIGKNDTTTADVTVKNGSTTIARIPANAYRSEYRRIELTLAPSDGTVFQVEYSQKPRPLLENYQVPAPEVDTDFLVWYASSQIKRAQGNLQEAEFHMNRATQILQRRADFERNVGDQDFRAFPEPLYHADEDQYTWPSC